MSVYPSSLQPLADLASKVRTPDFLPAFGRMLDDYFPGINVAVFFYQQDQRPVTLIHNLSYEQEVKAIIALDNHYQNDPFYLYWLEHSAPTVKTLDEVVSDSFYQSDFYLQYYAKLGLYDEATAYFTITENGINGTRRSL